MANSESELKVSCRVFVNAMKMNRSLKLLTQIMSLKALYLVGARFLEGVFLE